MAGKTLPKLEMTLSPSSEEDSGRGTSGNAGIPTLVSQEATSVNTSNASISGISESPTPGITSNHANASLLGNGISDPPSRPILTRICSSLKEHWNKLIANHKFASAVIVAYVALAVPVYEGRSSTQACVEGIDMVISLVHPNASMTLRLDRVKKELEASERTVNSLTSQLDEARKVLDGYKKMEGITADSLCADYSSANTIIAVCKFDSCEDFKQVGLTQPFTFNVTSTDWFPTGCEDLVPHPPKCVTARGSFGQLVDRPNPDCKEKRQFQCQCGGQLPQYIQELERDCTAHYRTCKGTKRI